MKRMFLVASFAVLAACAHQPAKQAESDLAEQLTRVDQITLRVKNNKLHFGAMLDHAAQSLMSRQIEAAFALEPNGSPVQIVEHEETTAFQLPSVIAVDSNRRAILQRDVDAILTLLLQQEQRHGFHGSVPAEGTARTLTVEIVDSDDAGIVRASCETARTRLSTGFIRRLLERAIAATTSNEMFGFGDHPQLWPTGEERNWPPALVSAIAYWRAMSDAEGITMSKTVRRLFDLDQRLRTEVVPAIDAELAKRGMRSVEQYYEEKDTRSIDEIVEELADEVSLSGKPRKVLDEVVRAGEAIIKRADEDENSRESRELAIFEEEVNAFADVVMEPLFETFLVARFAQEQYLKALAFTVAHEAAHLWLDGCALPTNETENAADAFAVLVSFELFHHHHARVKLNATGLLELPEPPKDNTPFSDLIGEAFGWSGFDLVAETFGQSGIAPDAAHDDFETRQGSVRDFYLRLFNTAIVPATPQ